MSFTFPDYSCSGGGELSSDANIYGSCRDQPFARIMGESNPVSVWGCGCPPGQLFNEDNECVPVAECTCFDEYSVPGSQFKLPGSVTQRGCANW
jgi:hypothetical protein